MTTATLDTTLTQLQGMSLEELKQIRAHTGFLIDHAATDDEDFDKKFFYDAVCRKLREVGAGERPAPYANFRKSSGKRNLDRAWDDISGYIQRNFPRLKTNERRQAIKVLAGVLVQGARMHNVPLRPGWVFQHSDKIATYMDWAFPGYAEAGMLHFVVGVPKRKPRKRLRPDV